MTAKDFLWGTALVLCVSALSAGMVGMSVFQNRLDIEAAQFCQDAYLEEHTVVVIDRTDYLTAGQQTAANSTITGAADALNVGGKLSVYTITPEIADASPTPLFEGCRPKRHDDVSWLTANPKFAEANFADKFGVPVATTVAALEELAEAKTSPIMETLAALVDAPDWKTVPRRRLVLVSDLLQNVPAYSQYSTAPEILDFAVFSASEYAGTVALDLAGVDVAIVYLDRGNTKAGQFQPPAHRAFWAQVFGAARADTFSVTEAL